MSNYHTAISEKLHYILANRDEIDYLQMTGNHILFTEKEIQQQYKIPAHVSLCESMKNYVDVMKSCNGVKLKFDLGQNSHGCNIQTDW